MVKEEFELFRTAWPRFASCELQTQCIFFFFTSVGLKSSLNDVPVVLGDDVFFLLCFVYFFCVFLFLFLFFCFGVFCFCFRLLSLFLMLDVLNLMLIFHFHSYSYFHSHFLSHFHYDYHYIFIVRVIAIILNQAFFSSTRSQDQQRKIFGHALQFWADVSGLTFNEVSNARNADIKIR